MKFNGIQVNISPAATLETGVRMGDRTTVYDAVHLGAGTTVANDCILGEPLNAYYHDSQYQNPPLEIGAGSLIRSHALFYAGSQLGNHFSCGHRVTIREQVHLGDHCRIGTNCDVQNGVRMGHHSWLHSGIFLPLGTVLGNYVMVYPHVVFTNDLYPPSVHIGPVVVEDYAQIGAGAVILPGVKIGEGALVAAGSVVTRDVAPYALVAGNPARFIRDVRELQDAETGAHLYPWPQRFDRGMPWEDLDYDTWRTQQP